MNKFITLFAIVSLFFLVGCQGTGMTMPSKQTSGAVLGGVAGGIAGSQIGKGKGRDIAMVAGALLGAALGGAVGGSMDRTDLMYTQQTLEDTQTGTPASWTNPDTKSQYTVTPTRTFNNFQGQNCREYTTVAIIDGKREEMQGTACRQDDGSWKAQN